MNDQQTIALSPAEPSVRDRLARGYRELAAGNRALGLHALAVECELRASAVEMGSPIDWSLSCSPEEVAP